MDKYGEPPSSCSKRWLVVMNSVVALLALAGGVTGTVLYMTSKEAGIVENLPQWAFFMTIGFAGFIFLLSILGCVSAKSNSGLCMSLFIGLTIMVIIVQGVATVSLLMYTNDQPTLAPIDGALRDAQSQLEVALVEFALEQPEDWRKSQDWFECCGVDFEATFLYEKYNLTPDQFLAQTLTGTNRECQAQQAGILNIMAASTTFTPAAEQQVFDLVGTDFFCKDQIRTKTVERSMYLGIASGVMVLFQIISLGCALSFMCSSSRDEYGGAMVAPGPPPTSFYGRVSQRFQRGGW